MAIRGTIKQLSEAFNLPLNPVLAQKVHSTATAQLFLNHASSNRRI